MADLHEYKCKNCGAPLRFDPQSGKLKCDSCGNLYSISDFEEKEKAKGPENQEGPKQQNSSQHFENTTVYRCKSCGAQVETDLNTVATTCPYCGNNVFVEERASGGLKPDVIIPFAVTGKDVAGKVKDFYSDKRFLPKGFTENNKLGKVQGVYVPFWLYSANMEGEAHYTGEIHRHHSTPDEEITEIDHFALHREGNADFTDIPADASQRMDNNLMDSLEPYNYGGFREFSGDYLAGFLAERYDSDSGAEWPRARERMETSIAAFLRSTTTRFQNVIETGSNYVASGVKSKYAMFPAYVFNSTYKEKKYRYAMNGQTGKVVGELPISAGKATWFGIWNLLAALGVLMVVFLIVIACMGNFQYLANAVSEAFKTGFKSLKGDSSWLAVPAAGAVIALIFAIIRLVKEIRKMKTVRPASGAQDYMGRRNLTVRQDIYMGTTVHRVRKPKPKN